MERILHTFAQIICKFVSRKYLRVGKSLNKKFEKILVLVVISFAFTACNKCQDCDCSNLDLGKEKVCKRDFDFNEDYNDAIA